jgi:hypothetical protein
MQILGERLFSRVLPQAPSLASKVTGMLMDMGPEVIHCGYPYTVYEDSQWISLHRGCWSCWGRMRS